MNLGVFLDDLCCDDGVSVVPHTQSTSLFNHREFMSSSFPHNDDTVRYDGETQPRYEEVGGKECVDSTEVTGHDVEDVNAVGEDDVEHSKCSEQNACEDDDDCWESPPSSPMQCSQTLQDVSEVLAANNTISWQYSRLVPRPKKTHGSLSSDHPEGFVPVTEYTNAAFTKATDLLDGTVCLKSLMDAVQFRQHTNAIAEYVRRGGGVDKLLKGRGFVEGNVRGCMEEILGVAYNEGPSRRQQCGLCREKKDVARNKGLVSLKDITAFGSHNQRQALFDPDNGTGLLGEDLWCFADITKAVDRYDTGSPLQVAFNLTPTKHHLLQTIRRELQHNPLPLLDIETDGGEVSVERPWLDVLLTQTVCQQNQCFFRVLYDQKIKEIFCEHGITEARSNLDVRPIVLLPSCIGIWYNQRTRKYRGSALHRLDPVMHLPDGDGGKVAFFADENPAGEERMDKSIVSHVELRALIDVLYRFYVMWHGVTTATAGMTKTTPEDMCSGSKQQTGAMQKRRRDYLESCLACVVYKSMAKTWERRAFATCEECHQRLCVADDFEEMDEELFRPDLEHSCSFVTNGDATRAWLCDNGAYMYKSHPLVDYHVVYDQDSVDPIQIEHRKK